MNWIIPAKIKKNMPLHQASLALRLVLRKGELYRLPARSRGIEVVSGTAWVTVAGDDTFLGPGERLALPASSEAVLVSGLSQMPLILEVLRHRSTAASGAILTPQPDQPGPI